jgi:hypothetical protein
MSIKHNLSHGGKIMEKSWIPKLKEAVQETAKAARGGVTRLAEFLGKSGATFRNEINPNPDPNGNRTHKLGLIDWVRILLKTRDFRSLHLICALCGFVAIRFEAHAADDLCWLTYQAKHAHAHSNAGLALLNLLAEKGHLSPERRKKLIEEFYKAAQEAMNIAHALEHDDGGGLVAKAA